MRLNKKNLLKPPLHPPLAALAEHRIEVAFEQGAGVGEVLLRVGFGAGQLRKRFVEDGDYALLLGQRGDGDLDFH